MTSTIATDHSLSLDEQRILRKLAGLIVPPDAGLQVPGADDPVIFADIVESARSQGEEIKAALRYVMAQLMADDQELAQFEGDPQVAPIVVLVMQCYYRDDRVMISLGMEARAPFPKGFELEQGDWSLLEPVQRRGKIWRDA